MRKIVILMVMGAALGIYAQWPGNLYHGELVSYPGAWSFQLSKAHIILVSDAELEALSNPDRAINLSISSTPQYRSLRQICESAQAKGQRTLVLAFDHFFSQYRPGQGDKPRRLTPDTDEYIRRIGAISQFAAKYGLGLELSLLSPLEIGKGYEAKTGESGFWLHYREGVRDPRTGAFSVQLWRQERWANNKGAIQVQDAGVRVFAFHERVIAGTPYRVVNPSSIVEIKDDIHVQVFENSVSRTGDYMARRIRVYGEVPTEQKGLDHVLVVQKYRTPEMDYFSPRALPFLTNLLDRYFKAGVRLNGLYSDEMHIQQDWAYFHHQDHGEFALRYVTDNLAREYASRYGSQYRDLGKFMVYFCYGQADFVNDLTARQGILHVFGSSPEAIRRTALFRARYYHLLQDGVVDLFVQAKHYAEQKWGHRLEARAHATWAESPTIDYWYVGRQNQARNKYEYTSNFVWSNTVQQAASACDDYFKWGDYLTGNGNDDAEGGWLDRDYFGLAMACSTGILNDVPYSYAAHWGMPAEVSRRRAALVNTYGAGASPEFGMVQDMQHRDVNVLMLYPLDLVAVEERFGSWMTQYGYANYVTAAKLLERGRVKGNAIEMAGRRFTTLATTFEPFPSRKLLELMRQFVKGGGQLIWSGPPPVLTWEGDPALATWQDVFGVEYSPEATEGLLAPGKRVTFEGPLAGVAPQMILTDFLVDHVYPVRPKEGTQVAARVKDWVVGTQRRFPGGGTATFLGYRPRDDQSRSLGYETSDWFQILNTLKAYPPTGHFAEGNDNTEYVSRTSKYLVCRFPNGAVALAPHLRTVEEGWGGGFFRNRKVDQEYLKLHPLPSDAIHVRDFRVNGHSVTYDGTGAVCFHVNRQGQLIGFAGEGAREITIDGHTTVFADRVLPEVTWAPVPAERRVPGGAILQAVSKGAGLIHIPSAGLPERLEIFAEGTKPGSRGISVPCRRTGETFEITVPREAVGRWLYGVPTSN